MYTIECLYSFYNKQSSSSGEACDEDFDGCEDSPCTAGTNCTDMSPSQEDALGTAFNCSECPLGYKDNDGICVGTYHIVHWHKQTVRDLPSSPVHLNYLHTLRQHRQLWSSSSNLLAVPTVKTNAGTRTFSVAVPTLWNTLPDNIN